MAKIDNYIEMILTGKLTILVSGPFNNEWREKLGLKTDDRHSALVFQDTVISVLEGTSKIARAPCRSLQKLEDWIPLATPGASRRLLRHFHCLLFFDEFGEIERVLELTGFDKVDDTCEWLIAFRNMNGQMVFTESKWVNQFIRHLGLTDETLEQFKQQMGEDQKPI
jgi:hypothetical protein